MEPLDLLHLQETFNQQQIMLCFNGPISQSLIEEIGNALRNYLEADKAAPSAAIDVFAIYIEMTQNIRHYSTRNGYQEQEAIATVVISRDGEGHYAVSAGNLVQQPDGEALLARLDALAMLDKTQLKAAYKDQMRKPRDGQSSSGAGLGLIDISRKASAPLTGSLRPVNETQAFISLRALI